MAKREIAELKHQQFEAESSSLQQEVANLHKRQERMVKDLWKYEEKYKNLDLDEMHRKIGQLNEQILIEQGKRTRVERTVKKIEELGLLEAV